MIGDIRYGIVEGAQKGSHHPDSRATGRALRESLACGYSYAQQNPRFLGSWSVPHNTGRNEFITLPNSTAQMILFEARVRVPEYITHIRAASLVGIPSSVDYTYRKYISVDGNVIVKEDFEVSSSTPRLGGFLQTGFGMVSHVIEGPYKPGTGGEGQIIDLVVYIRRGSDSTDSSSSSLYIPHSCVVMGECRG